MRPAPIVLLAAAALLLPGCIVRDIRDELTQANASLVSLDAGRKQVNEQLSELHTRLEVLDPILASLERIDASLVSVETELDRANAGLGEIDQSLASMQERMDSLDASLKKLDEHLASLRQTINNIDSTIPFLKLSGDDEEDTGEEMDEPSPASESEPPTDPAALPTAGG